MSAGFGVNWMKIVGLVAGIVAALMVLVIGASILTIGTAVGDYSVAVLNKTGLLTIHTNYLTVTTETVDPSLRAVGAVITISAVLAIIYLMLQVWGEFQNRMTRPIPGVA